MMPIRASIVGPPDVATRIKACIAACHSGASCSALGSLVMKVPASFVTSSRPRGSGIVERALPTAVRHRGANHAACARRDRNADISRVQSRPKMSRVPRPREAKPPPCLSQLSKEAVCWG